MAIVRRSFSDFASGRVLFYFLIYFIFVLLFIPRALPRSGVCHYSNYFDRFYVLVSPLFYGRRFILAFWAAGPGGV